MARKNKSEEAPEIKDSDLMMPPQKGETVPDGFTCENCLARDFFAEVFDAVIDWRECTDCAYAEERRKE